MNINFLEHYMKTKPKNDEQKYIFLVDNQDLALSIIGAGYLVVALLPSQDGFHSLKSFSGIIAVSATQKEASNTLDAFFRLFVKHRYMIIIP